MSKKSRKIGHLKQPAMPPLHAGISAKGMIGIDMKKER